MTGHKGNSEFCFPETLKVPRGEAEGILGNPGATSWDDTILSGESLL